MALQWTQQYSFAQVNLVPCKIQISPRSQNAKFLAVYEEQNVAKEYDGQDHTECNVKARQPGTGDPRSQSKHKYRGDEVTDEGNTHQRARHNLSK